MLVLSAGPGTLGVAPSFVVTGEVATGDLPADLETRLEAFADRQAGQMRTRSPLRSRFNDGGPIVPVQLPNFASTGYRTVSRSGNGSPMPALWTAA